MIYINIVEKQWSFINHLCCYEMDFKYVDFNILFKGKELDNFLYTYSNNLISKKSNRGKKQYFTGEYLRFDLDKSFIYYLFNFGI